MNNIKQNLYGVIVSLDLGPTRGHEQKGRRPVVIISNKEYQDYVGMALVCPISNTNNGFPLHIPLDERTKTTGYVLCEQLRSIDIVARNAKVIENIPDDILEDIRNVIIKSID